MYVLHSFISPAVKLLGSEQFLAVYLSAGVISSLASMVYKVASRELYPEVIEHDDDDDYNE